MRTILQSVDTRRLLAIVLSISSVLMSGCRLVVESSFDLAKESRLPKWMTIPPGLTRANVSVTMNYYTEPWGGEARFILKDDQGKTLETVDASMKCWGPIKPKHPPPGSSEHYPAYEVITVKGVNEMIEHRKPEPFFYVTDDAAMWKQYLATGCD